ncbi:MAG TPA: DNA topoisomerase I [Nitrososphaeraceae archaeon]|jgi:DNA topoisomerase-1|nr:DNA topoisomerase I [Nitrososphaeraceae archaeon]
MESSVSAATTNNSSTIASVKWSTLEHRGVAFPPEYQSRGIGIVIRGERFILNHDQEELIYAWAKKKNTHYIQDPIFQSNFLIDLRALLPEKYRSIDFINDIDFSEAFRLVDHENTIKEAEIQRIKNLPKDEKRKISLHKKEERERLKAIYGKAIVDGVEVEIANWLVEPPGLFMGRGQHPLRGKWKPRVRAQDVILNLGENAPVPEGAWKDIVHDHSSTWLATWIEKITGKRKYVWLHDSAVLRQSNDKEKYDKAKKLEKYIGKVQKQIIRIMLNSNNINQKKVATVCYLIFKLAMRVGDEKDPDEADTVGASTLRVEHIKFPEKNGKQLIEFNFLGKDSVPWQKTLEVNSQDTRGLYNNLKLFMNGKEHNSPIFDRITSSKVNIFLRSIDPKNVPGLTAKVFRTYIATKTVKEELSDPKIRVDKNSSEIEKIYVMKMANLKAAITCNHKKGIDPKNPASKKALEKFELALRNKEESIKRIRSDIAAKKWKTEIQKRRLEDRLEKLEMHLKLQKETRDYNLGTSLRNYIDPRVMRAWLNYVQLDWRKIYTTTLQRKFKWVDDYSNNKLKEFCPIREEIPLQEMKIVHNES